MPSEIKPCPACEAGDARVARFARKDSDGDFTVTCWGCRLTGPDCPTEEEAVAKWNRLYMRPGEVTVAGDFGEPWPKASTAYDAIDISQKDYARARVCVNAFAGLNPEALGEFIESAEQLGAVIRDSRGVEGYHLNGDAASWDEVGGDTFVAALTKLKKGGE